ncbi:MAG: ribonuclease P protein component [Rhodothermales bacterium]
MPADDHARRNTLPRSLRLKRQRLIRALFDRDQSEVRSVRSGGLVVRYRLAPHDDVGQRVPLQAGFTTGRQIGSKPVRNRIKRVMREHFRVHRHALSDLFASRPNTLTLMFLYRGKPDGAAGAIARDLPAALRKIEGAFAHADAPAE